MTKRALYFVDPHCVNLPNSPTAIVFTSLYRIDRWSYTIVVLVRNKIFYRRRYIDNQVHNIYCIVIYIYYNIIM